MNYTNSGAEDCKICGNAVHINSVDALCPDCEDKYNQDWEDEYVPIERIISRRNRGNGNDY